MPARKHRTYSGYQELAYTHLHQFTPDPERLTAYGLTLDEPFIFVRLVAWALRRAHDTRDHGFTRVENAIRQLERFGRVVISSEAQMPFEHSMPTG